MNILHNSYRKFVEVYIANRCHCRVIDKLSDMRGWGGGEDTLEYKTVTVMYPSHVAQCFKAEYCQIVSAFKTVPALPCSALISKYPDQDQYILGQRSRKYLVMNHIMTGVIMLTSSSSLKTSLTVGQEPEPSQHVWAYL